MADIRDASYSALLKFAGTEVSAMFEMDPSTGDIRPIAWPGGCDKLWWTDDSLILGRLTTRAQQVRIVNTLTSTEHVVTVPSEMTVAEIIEYYIRPVNGHPSSYRLKYLNTCLDVSKTLEGNRISATEADDLEKLGLDPSEFIPTIRMHFVNDLMIA